MTWTMASLEIAEQWHKWGGFWFAQKVLRLRTICYIKLVLAFGTGQDIIVNSRHPRSRCSQRSISQSLMSFTKNATCESGIVLVSLRMSYPGKSNHSSYRTSVVSTVYIGEI
jgi:hypothetical protein